MAPVPTLERPEPPSAREDDTPLIELTDPDEIELEGGRMSFLEHLDELRKRLISSLIGIAIGCVISFIFLDTYILPFIMGPMQQMLPRAGRSSPRNLPKYFMLWLKMGFFGGLLLAMPLILFQVWLFVAPGLYSHEKRFAIPFVLFASLFFFGGAMFSHYMAFPVTWGFFIDVQPVVRAVHAEDRARVQPLRQDDARLRRGVPDAGAGVRLARMGMVTAGFLLRNFKYAVLIIAIAGAVLSPGGDIASQMILSGPMLVLYVVSIGVAWVFQKRKPRTNRLNRPRSTAPRTRSRWPTPDVPSLIQGLRGRGDRREAAMARLTIAGKRAVARLVEAYQDTTDRELQVAILRVLEAIGDERALGTRRTRHRRAWRRRGRGRRRAARVARPAAGLRPT